MLMERPTYLPGKPICRCRFLRQGSRASSVPQSVLGRLALDLVAPSSGARSFNACRYAAQGLSRCQGSRPRSAPLAIEAGAGEAGAFRLSRLASFFKEPAGQSWCRCSQASPLPRDLTCSVQSAYVILHAAARQGPEGRKGPGSRRGTGRALDRPRQNVGNVPGSVQRVSFPAGNGLDRAAPKAFPAGNAALAAGDATHSAGNASFPARNETFPAVNEINRGICKPMRRFSGSSLGWRLAFPAGNAGRRGREEP